MKKNIYEDPEFFIKYSDMPRSIGGLDAAGEWPSFRALLPELRGKRLLDLGCGFGWQSRYAREQQAQSVVGVDLSEKMLARAKQTQVPKSGSGALAFVKTGGNHWEKWFIAIPYPGTGGSLLLATD